MSGGKLTASLQESVLTLICTNDEEGAIASGIIDPDLFEPPYNDIAEKALGYRRKFGKAPGLAHLDDLFDHILSNPKHKQARLYQQSLGGIIDQAKGLNAKYVLSRTNDFLSQQNLHAAVLEAAQRYGEGGADLIPDIQNILHKALKFKVESLDAGTFLNDKKRALAFLTNPKADALALGIPELDRRGIGPTPGEALAFTAPKGRGKTWFCVHAATKVLLQGARVVHISLEMSEERLMQRYFQHLFAISKRDEKFDTTVFEFDELNRLMSFAREERRARLNFQDPKIAAKIGKRMDEWGSRFGRLVVKQFPTSTLSVDALQAYLDGLDLSYKFTPTVLILDYPKLMSLDRRQDLRIALGLAMEQLRGVCIARNLAGVFPLQSNRAGEDTKIITGKHVGEDYSLGQTADIHLTYNQTMAEKSLGLARLYVDKARNDDDGFTILISQNYQTGQFVRQSTYMPGSKYWKLVKAEVGETEEEE